MHNSLFELLFLSVNVLKMLMLSSPLNISFGPDGCAEMLKQSFLLHLRLLRNPQQSSSCAERGEVEEEGGDRQYYRGNVWSAQRPSSYPFSSPIAVPEVCLLK